jgi:hypothetical protein
MIQYLKTIFKYLVYRLTLKLLGCSKVQFHTFVTNPYGYGWYLEEKVAIMEALLRGEYREAPPLGDSKGLSTKK